MTKDEYLTLKELTYMIITKQKLSNEDIEMYMRLQKKYEEWKWKIYNAD